MAPSPSSPSPPIDPDLVISHKFPETTFSYSERDVALYALGVGACRGDAVDENELEYVYHRDGQHAIKVLPTFGALFPFYNEQSVEDVPGLHFDPRLLLHAQQYMELYKPFPTGSCIQNKVAIAGLHDKEYDLNFSKLLKSKLEFVGGKATIIEIETTSYEKGSGEVLCMNRNSVYLRGVGGFSKSKAMYSYTKYPPNNVFTVKIPKHPPSKTYEDATQKSQALLYRLSGDYNPLHSDPGVASLAGFKHPILHGLCTYGFAVRAIIKCFCNGEPTAVKSIFGRFLLHVYPGETLITEMWQEGSRIIYQTKVKERDRAVLSGYVVLNHIFSSL